MVHTGSGAHPASYSMGTKLLFPGINRPGREVDLSLPSCTYIKIELSYTFPPPVRLHDVDRANFNFFILEAGRF
jgi:hypothetical protein